MNTPILIIIATLAIVGVIANERKAPEPETPQQTIEATIVAVYQTSNGDWWTTLSWGTSDRGSWNNKLGREGEKIKLYAMRNGQFSIHPTSPSK